MTADAVTTLLEDVDSENEHFVLVKALDAALNAVVAVYENAQIPLPERRYWTLSSSAADCEQVVVAITQLYIGTPNEQVPVPTPCDGPRTYTISVQVLRCIPAQGDDGSPPSPEAIMTASAYQAIDMWLLADSAQDIAGIDREALVTVDAGQAEGGFQGVTATITQMVPF